MIRLLHLNFVSGSSPEEVEVCLVSEELVGLDIVLTLTLELDRPNTESCTTPAASGGGGHHRACRHQCSNKLYCAHPCCKFGIKTKVGAERKI